MLCLVAWGRTWGTGSVDIRLFERAFELAAGSAEAEAFAATTYGSLLGYVPRESRARELLSSVIALGPYEDNGLPTPSAGSAWPSGRPGTGT